ncbi:MAG TPA: class I SAM-dependent methyltransferase [bacterium]|nr:class I SAM-dependent methyltransferase [bacterium]
MSQITNGIRKILGHPLVYRFVQSLAGMDKARYTREYLRPMPGMKILDVGCGTADLLAHFPKPIEYYGVDLNADYIHYAERKFGEKGTFVCGDANDAVLDSKHEFDLIIANGLLHHLEDQDAMKLLEKMASRLRPAGRVVTFDPCYTDNPTRLVSLIMKWDRGQNIRSAENYRKLAVHAFNRIKVHVRDNLSRIPHCTVAILEYSGQE